MAQTSIHIRPLPEWAGEIEKREKDSACIREDLTKNNEMWSSIVSVSKRRAEIKKIVLARTGRKMQKRAVPIKEGIVLISENTSMYILKNLAANIKELLGVETVQIFIHKDSGHWEEGKWIPNYHAHFVFDWYNHETGKSFRFPRQLFNKLQSITSETLGMDRGTSNDSRHLSSIQYKLNKIQRKHDEIKKECDELIVLKEKLLAEISQLKSKYNSIKQDEKKHNC